jgi:hypothetical protein
MSTEKPDRWATDATAAATKMGEDMTSQFANIANLYGGALGASYKAVQDYQTKLMQFLQANAEANVRFTQKLIEARSPSDFVQFLSSHMRDRAVAMGEQAKELASLSQEASRTAMESLTQPKR